MRRRNMREVRRCQGGELPRLSKRKGQRRKRRKASKKHTRAAFPKSPAERLSAIAALLNSAEDSGSPVRAGYGGLLLSEAGLLLPPPKRGKPWELRLVHKHPLSPPWDPDDED